MRRFFMLVVAVTTAALSVVGCGSDSNGGSSNTAGASSQCVGNNSEYTPAQFSAQTESSKGCSAASDVSGVCANDLPVIGGTCGKSCLGMGDDAAQAECVAGCMQDNLSPQSEPLSSDCMACYTTDIECARKHCVFPCGKDPTSADCFVCRTDNGCVDAFYACSGLPDPGPPTGS
jgi:hypothetical protein